MEHSKKIRETSSTKAPVVMEPLEKSRPALNMVNMINIHRYIN